MTVKMAKLTVSFEEDERKILNAASDIVFALKQEMEHQHVIFAIDNCGGEWNIDEIENTIIFYSRLANCDYSNPLEIE